MAHKNTPAESSVRIARSMFTLSNEFSPAYVSFRIRGNGVENLYLRFLDEKEGTCVKRHTKKGIYESTVPFNIRGSGNFSLEKTTLDDVEYYKIGENIS